MSSARPRVLLAITVYNGRAFVPRCLTSAKGLETPSADVDVLVLDDCSPEPGFSELIAEQCKRQGIYYYRTPRNLGIVRNVNMGLLAAVEKGYDYVIISNSDVIYSKQTVEMLLAASRSSPRIGSVTAWSNNVSIFSIPNVGHYSIVEDLIAGRWDYLPIGLLCYTHFRFFTRHTLADWATETAPRLTM